MRIRPLTGICILSLSLAANLVLWLKIQTGPPVLESAHTSNPPSAVAITNRPVLPEQPHPTKVTWQDLEDPSFPNLIANLRAVKCPELTIRDIVTSRLDEQLDAQIADINQPMEFWSTAIQKERLQQKQRENVRELERENEKQVREWFGDDWNRDAYLYWVYDPYNEFFLGFLPREKAMAVEFDIQDIARTAEAAFKGRDIAPRGDDQELQRLSRQLKSRLSPTEYTELNLRFLVTMIHPWGLPDVQLSGADVRHIVTLYARHLDFIDDYLKGPNEFDAMKKSSAAAVQDEIRNYLGPDRYIAFQRANDLQYVWLHKFALDAGLSPDTAEKVFNMKAEASRQALEISQNGALAADVRTQQLNDLRDSYRATITKMLGEDTMKKYAYASGAWWDKLGEVTNSGGAK